MVLITSPGGSGGGGGLTSGQVSTLIATAENSRTLLSADADNTNPDALWAAAGNGDLLEVVRPSNRREYWTHNGTTFGVAPVQIFIPGTGGGSGEATYLLERANSTANVAPTVGEVAAVTEYSGVSAFVDGDNIQVTLTDGSEEWWEVVSGSPVRMSFQEYDANTAKIDESQAWTATQYAVPDTLAFSATISDTAALTTSLVQQLTLTGDCAITVSGGVEGQRRRYDVLQDATGGWTLAWSGIIGVAPTLGLNAGDITSIEIEYTFGAWRFVSASITSLDGLLTPTDIATGNITPKTGDLDFNNLGGGPGNVEDITDGAKVTNDAGDALGSLECETVNVGVGSAYLKPYVGSTTGNTISAPFRVENGTSDYVVIGIGFQSWQLTHESHTPFTGRLGPNRLRIMRSGAAHPNDFPCEMGVDFATYEDLHVVNARTHFQTDFETLRFHANTTEYLIGSAIGSAGGSNRAVQLGHFDAAGAFTAAFTVETTGRTSFGGILFASNTADGNRVGRLNVDYFGSDNPELSSPGGTIFVSSPLSFRSGYISAPSSRAADLTIEHNRAGEGFVFQVCPVTNGIKENAFFIASDKGCRAYNYFIINEGLGVFGATPPASQPAAIADVPTAGSATSADNATALNSILAALRGSGLIAT